MRISDWSSDVCSSDLARRGERTGRGQTAAAARRCDRSPARPAAAKRAAARRKQQERSEEHTSELQSLMRISYAVFCLKKKKNHRQTIHKLNNNLHNRTQITYRRSLYTIYN